VIEVAGLALVTEQAARLRELMKVLPIRDVTLERHTFSGSGAMASPLRRRQFTSSTRRPVRTMEPTFGRPTGNRPSNADRILVSFASPERANTTKRTGRRSQVSTN
jgi:hypothetical protein